MNVYEYTILNSHGREMTISKEDYERLKEINFKMTLVCERKVDKPTVEIKNEKKPKSNKIGIYPQRYVSKETHCASDRIRCDWIIKNSNKFELYDHRKEYETVIFHKPVPEIADCKGLKVLDLCDSVWKHIPDFNNLIKPVDAIIVSTEGLKEELAGITDKRVYVIGDGHDLEHYKTKLYNRHWRKAKDVVWFGYAQNAHCLAPLFRVIKENGLKLKVISQCPLPPIDKADTFVKWDIDTYIREISKCDFAILPINGKLKSNNKDVTAYLSGIPVAKDAKDIKRLVNPKERREDMKKAQKLVKEYDIKDTVEEYIKTIQKVKYNLKIYTSICGGFEKPRKDILVFTDKDSDKFKYPVMNAKIYKILPHKFFDAEYSVYMDGNIFPLVGSKELLELLGDSDMALFKHPYRKCLYEEAPEARKKVSNPQKIMIDEQVRDYKREGMPEYFGLAECGMIIRRHNAVVEEFNNRWWAEICRYSQRDQMSFPYVWWKMRDRIKIKFIEGNVRNHKFFKYEQHKGR